MAELQEKTCRKCGETKPLPSFSRHPSCKFGRTNECKVCEREYSRAKYRRKRDQILRKQRERYRAKRDKINARLSNRRYDPVSAEKQRAREAVHWAVRSGRLDKPDACADCKERLSPHLIQAHHEDYSKPLEVHWLCSSCHGKRHRSADPQANRLSKLLPDSKEGEGQ